MPEFTPLTHFPEFLGGKLASNGGGKLEKGAAAAVAETSTASNPVKIFRTPIQST